MQPLPVLARVAAEIGEMTLGTGIMLLALQHPVDVAESLATLDVICGGRLVFGVGLGYRDVEFDAFGIPRGRRLSRFLEALDVVRLLWTEDSVTFHGEHFHLEDVGLTMKPRQKPRPPIVVAASNDKMVRRVARIGDAWAIAGHATLATLERLLLAAGFAEVRPRRGRFFDLWATARKPAAAPVRPMARWERRDRWHPKRRRPLRHSHNADQK